uniref:ABC transmembrane type-1 domain-containing protein n=1 Tax=Macrostomum lignano TaxID=282301 RepID=A0A1I8FAF1_9PLAT
TEEPPRRLVRRLFLFSQPYDIYTWLGVLGATATTAKQCQLRPVCTSFVLRLLVFVPAARGRVDCRISRQLEFWWGRFGLFSLVVLINYAARLGAQPGSEAIQICNAHLSAYFQNYEVAFAIPQLSELRDLVSGEISLLHGEPKGQTTDCRTSDHVDHGSCSGGAAGAGAKKRRLTLAKLSGHISGEFSWCTAAVLAALMERLLVTVLYRYRELRSQKQE